MIIIKILWFVFFGLCIYMAIHPDRVYDFIDMLRRK